MDMNTCDNQELTPEQVQLCPSETCRVLSLGWYMKESQRERGQRREHLKKRYLKTFLFWWKILAHTFKKFSELQVYTRDSHLGTPQSNDRKKTWRATGRDKVMMHKDPQHSEELTAPQGTPVAAGRHTEGNNSIKTTFQHRPDLQDMLGILQAEIKKNCRATQTHTHTHTTKHWGINYRDEHKKQCKLICFYSILLK